MASGSITLKAKGLQLSPNQLEVEAGSLQEANNVIIRREDVIESRRGFKLYGESFGSASDRAKQLMSYKNRILRHYSNKIQFDTATTNPTTGEEIFSTFSGNYTEQQTGLRIKSFPFNGNFYFTSSEGVKKIAAASASNLTTASGFITQSGGIKAIDQTAILDVTQGSTNGFLTQDSAVAYRIVWGIKDANGNLVLGTPSQRTIVYNPLSTLLIYDTMAVLEALDSVVEIGGGTLDGSGLSGSSYVSSFKVDLSTDTSTVRAKLIALCSALDTDIGISTFSEISRPNVITTTIANDTGNNTPLTITSSSISAGACTINFSNGSASQYFTTSDVINLTGFTTTSGTINGSQTIASVGNNYITFSTIATGTVTIVGTTITQDSVSSNLDTNLALLEIQTYISDIIAELQAQSNSVIPTQSLNTYILTLFTTTSANVQLKIDIPQNVTTSNFFQIYRSTIAEATGTEVLFTDVLPNDELQQVYEAFPTTTDLSNGYITVVDSTPETFLGAFLYTNESSGDGQGILGANEIPPFCLDTAVFKNVAFYANTRTKYQLSFNLLGVQQMITDYNLGTQPTFTIADENIENTYKFVLGVRQSSTIGCNAGSTLNASGPASYFNLNSASDETEYYAWYKIGTATDPAIAGKTGIEILATASDSASRIAIQTSDTLAGVLKDFTSSFSSSQVTVTNVNFGYTTSISDGNTSFTFNTVTSGKGERASTGEILLAQETSIGQSINETAESLVRVLNQNTNEIVYAYYLSTTNVPGQILLEKRDLDSNPFYIVGNNHNTGLSFNPDITPSVSISSVSVISIANPTIISSTSHGLINQTKIIITNSNCTPTINGVREITFVDNNHFSIPINVTATQSISTIAYITLEDAATAQNNDTPNGIYYSKYQEPEAVPTINYFPVGAKDKPIYRIVPLRDTLFVFKEDGLYRISGEVAPFVLSLFDSSCILIAPDSVGIANNLIYCWTQQGLTIVNEAAVSNPPLSRPIDTAILPLSTYSNFSTATWGIGYPSDNSYIVNTLQSSTDTKATIAYRYGVLTNTWTTFDKTNTCGLVNPADDKLYLGSGDTNHIEQERKSFTRTDYADKELSNTIPINSLAGNTIKLANVIGISTGDVLLQTQTLTSYDFNVLLEKLDIDITLAVVNVSSISTGSTPTIVTSANHNLINGEYVELTSTNSTPSIDGTFQITYVSPTQFTISPGFSVTATGSSGKARYLYYDNLHVGTGINLKDHLLALSLKLDSDPNTIYKNYHSDIISKSGSISSITASNPTILTSTAHGLQNNRIISISGSNSSPTIDGTRTVMILSSSTFSIPVSVVTIGTSATWSTLDSNFNDLKACFNKLIADLNSDAGVSFNNYELITYDTEEEAVITNVNQFTKQITLNQTLDFIAGAITIFKAIDCQYTYSPITLGDSLNMKQIFESTLMFSNKAFTSASLSFATDLLPAFTSVQFNGDGNGIFGSQTFGFGNFGGASHGAPFRTIIPALAQRCRYMIVQFNHTIAREQWAIFGHTLTGNVAISSRGYR